MGQAKAEHMPSALVPNATSLTRSRSIDFVLLMTLGEAGFAAVTLLDHRSGGNGYGAATLEKLTHTLPVAGLRKIESAAQGTRRRLVVLS